MNKIVLKQIQLVMTAGGTDTSDAIDLGAYSNEHRFSLQAIITGSGILSLIALCSNDGLNFVESSEPVILENESAGTTAPKDFTIPMCKFIKFKGTETGEASTVTVNIAVCIQ